MPSTVHSPLPPQASSPPDPLDLDRANTHLERAEAARIVDWAARAFEDGLVVTSSFGAQSALMLHLATRVVPDVPVIFIDTGYLFPETYRFAEDLRQRLGLNLHIYAPRMTPARLEATHGRLWEQGDQGLQRYLQIMKVEPMQRALAELGATAWLAGLRQGQTDHRAALRPVEQQDGRYKIHPVLSWTTKQVHQYLTRHDLPYHPLYHQGYASIGDVHSTQPITAQQHERDGRFNGMRQECGIHLPASDEENQSRASSGL